MLWKIVADTSFHPDKRDIADGLLDLFSTKQFIASAYLFREIFAITGRLSRILQSVNIDFGKALNLLDAALEQLTQLRDNPQSVIDAVEKDFAEIEWKEKRTGRRRRMPGELAAERSFSTLKRVKTRLRSSMVQNRLEGLMLMSIERNILLNLDREKLINLLGESSSELRKLLL